MVKKGLLPPAARRRRCACGCDGTELQTHPHHVVSSGSALKNDNDYDVVSREFKWGDEVEVSFEESDKEVEELEKEMWDRFYSTGFWRSPSQREPPSLPSTT